MPDTLIKRENIIIGLLLNGKCEVYNQVKNILLPEDFKNETNKKIIKYLYEEFKTGNSNINNILEFFEDDEETINRLTEIMADDYEIKNDKKAIEELVNNYQKERWQNRKKEIIEELNEASQEEAKVLEKELHEIIIKLAKLK